jgi:hypothetical protein
MFQFLEKLRQKSDRGRKQIAFIIALFFTGLIFVVWLSIIYPSWYQVESKQGAASKLEPGPIDTLSQIISGGVSSIGSEINKAKDSYSQTSTNPTSTTTSAE